LSLQGKKQREALQQLHFITSKLCHSVSKLICNWTFCCLFTLEFVYNYKVCLSQSPTVMGYILSTYTKVCSKLQSLFTKDTDVRLGNQPGVFYFFQKNILPPQTFRNPKAPISPQVRKINIHKNINKYLPYAYRTYISYNWSNFSTSKLCHSSLLTSKLACHFLIFYIFFIFFKVIKPESKLCHYKGRNSEKPCNNYISTRANFVTTWANLFVTTHLLSNLKTLKRRTFCSGVFCVFNWKPRV